MGRKMYIYLKNRKNTVTSHSSMECRDFIRDNPIPIVKALAKQYNGRPIQKVMCVPEKNVREFIKEHDIKHLDANI